MSALATACLDDPVAGLEPATEPAVEARPAIAPEDAAVAAGVAPASILGVWELSRSHWVHRVATRDGDVVVKQARASHRDAGRTLDHETFACRVAGWVPGLREVLPEVRLVDERNQLVVLAAGEPVWWDRLPDAGLVGSAVARVHAATAELPVPFGTNDGVLHLATTDPDDVALRGEGRRHAAELRADDAVVELLAVARAASEPSCLVHGDLKWDNVLRDPASDGAVRVIDWELSGWGDPAWDLAAWFAQAVILGGCSGQVAEPFVRAYAATAGPDPERWRRVARLAPARIVHIALETSEGGGDGAALIGTAVDLARRTDEVAERLSTWAAR